MDQETSSLSLKYSDVNLLLDEAGFSPEQLGARLGISGMSIRRWANLPQAEALPEVYVASLRELVYELLAEGQLTSDAKIAQKIVSQGDGSLFRAAITNLGFTEDFMRSAEPNSESFVVGLGQIGSHEKKQESVNRSLGRIKGFAKMGADWKYRISTLLKVIGSKKLSRLDKFAAYGALFYLLTPLDLIPDNIPVFGLVDDFFVLGMVTVYYVSRFPDIFKSE